MVSNKANDCVYSPILSLYILGSEWEVLAWKDSAVHMLSTGKDLIRLLKTMFPKASNFLSSSAWFSGRLCIIVAKRLLLTAMFFILEHCQNRYIHKHKKQLKYITC